MIEFAYSDHLRDLHAERTAAERARLKALHQSDRHLVFAPDVKFEDLSDPDSEVFDAWAGVRVTVRVTVPNDEAFKGFEVSYRYKPIDGPPTMKFDEARLKLMASDGYDIDLIRLQFQMLCHKIVRMAQSDWDAGGFSDAWEGVPDIALVAMERPVVTYPF